MAIRARSVLLGLLLVTGGCGSEPPAEPRAPAIEPLPADATFPDKGEVGVRSPEASLQVVKPPGGVLEIDDDEHELVGVKVIGGIDFTGRVLRIDDAVIEAGHGWWGAVVTRRHDSHVIITDSTIRTARPLDSDGVLPHGGGRITARRVDISGVVDGIKIGNRSTIEQCWIHDLAIVPGSHNDGIHMMGGDDIRVVANRIELNAPEAFDRNHHNGAVFVQPYSRPSMRTVLIERNFLLGGGYILRLEGDLSGVAVRDNVLGPVGTTETWAGHADVQSTVQLSEWSGNVVGDLDGRRSTTEVPEPARSAPRP